jgi:hypothetical protein
VIAGDTAETRSAELDHARAAGHGPSAAQAQTGRSAGLDNVREASRAFASELADEVGDPWADVSTDDADVFAESAEGFPAESPKAERRNLADEEARRMLDEATEARESASNAALQRREVLQQLHSEPDDDQRLFR